MASRKYQPIAFDTPLALDRQCWSYEGKEWNIARLITLSRDLPIIEAPLEIISLSYEAPCENNLLSFAQHVRAVNEADLKYPILLNSANVIMDGRHRLIKAILEGRAIIKVKRFEIDPSPDKILEDEDE